MINKKHLMVALAGIAMTATVAVVSAQTISTNRTAKILRQTRENILAGQNLRVSGSINTTLNPSNGSIFLRLALPQKQLENPIKFGFNFDGIVQGSNTSTPNATGTILTSWQINSTTTSPISIVTQGELIYVTSDALFQQFRNREWLNPTSTTSTILINFPQIAEKLGVSSTVKEKRGIIDKIIADPATYFTVRSLGSEVVNGVDTFHFRYNGTEALLDLFYPGTTSTTSSPSGQFNRIVRGEFWISKSTVLPVRLTIDSLLQGQGTDKTDELINIVFNMDQTTSTPDIVVPTSTRDVESLFGEVFLNLSNKFTTTTTTTPPTTTPPTSTTAVSISNFSFQPQEITVASGTAVTWTNNDTVVHTVTADDGSFDSGSIQPGGTFSRVFTTTSAYHCTPHPNMTGRVVIQ